MSPTGPEPQFSTAEYKSTGNTCKSCKQPISGNYYRINGIAACERCAQQLQSQMPKDSHAAYVRGIAFAVGGAILGFILFAGFVIVTGISLVYISLAVGFLVGKAMKMGSGGLGGRRYQVAAAALTYAAVSMAAIPISIYYMRENGAKHAHLRTGTNKSSQAESSDDGAVDNPPLTDSPSSPKPKTNFWSAVGFLALMGLASPFLELQSPLHGIIGLDSPSRRLLQESSGYSPRSTHAGYRIPAEQAEDTSCARRRRAARQAASMVWRRHSATGDRSFSSGRSRQ
jgi:hypothetical protein